MLENLKNALQSFTTKPLYEACCAMLHQLQISIVEMTAVPIPSDQLYRGMPKYFQSVMAKVKETYYIGNLDDSTLKGDDTRLSLDEVESQTREGKYKGIMVFAVDLREGETLTRTENAQLTRGFNRKATYQPVILFVRQGDHLSMSTCERLPYVQPGHEGEKIGKVCLLRNINCKAPHRGHIDVLNRLGEKKCSTFDELYQHLMTVFSSDELREEFYTKLQNWYAWAINNVQYPNDTQLDLSVEENRKKNEIYNNENVIRLITRLIFVWFLMHKGLVNRDLFDVDKLKHILKNFDPDSSEGNYYMAILQNLFFATLNQEIRNRKFVDTKIFHTDLNMIKSYYRNQKLFASDNLNDIIDLFNKTPYVNGGLFECLDKTTEDKHDYRFDGFSNVKVHNQHPNQALVPNYLFFGHKDVDLSEWYADQSHTSVPVDGIINILSQYEFTIEENTPLDEDVALDPELLGKVFENLLGAYNPETNTTARKNTGSFYTPRPIVEYIVKESLKAYLSKTCPKVTDGEWEQLFSYNDTIPESMGEEQSKAIMKALYNCKILDPGCGSGAFPMGCLQMMVHIMSKLDSDNSYWENIVTDEALRDASNISENSEEEKEKRLAEIHEVFNQNNRFPNYGRKLYLIERCIFGVDIQPIAVQISRLRCFISLLVDQKPNNNPNDNYGILKLPNLESNFVAANTLIPIELTEFERKTLKDKSIVDLIDDLKENRHLLFMPKNNNEKKHFKDRDIKLRSEIRETAKSVYEREIGNQIKSLEKDISESRQKLASIGDQDYNEVISTDIFGNQKAVKQGSLKDHYEQRIRTDENAIDSLKNRDSAIILSKIDDLTKWDPFNQNLSSSFFDPEWMFGAKDGFDIVIGNPPYVQLQNNGGELARLYAECDYKTFERMGDIYCLFYERGMQLLKPGGHLCFITSNKWMRAGYGKKTREYFAKNTNPKLLIDFAGVKIFESATVDTNILLLSKSSNEHKTLCAVTDKKDKESISNLSVFVQQHHTVCDFPSSDSWVILSPIEQSIKSKIEAVGTPLKDWDIQINYGIKTGCNEAFIIKTEKRDEILANCKDADERKRTEELIRPILRGRDIKRFGYKWADLWLINTHNGVKGKFPRIDINDYPAIKTHLDQYWDKISTRDDQGDTPYNLRNCAYLEDFYKPKLFYADITEHLNFCMCKDVMFCNNTTYFIVSENTTVLEHLQKYLNSPLIDWYYRTLSVQLGEKAVRMFSIYVLEIPIPPLSSNDDVYKAYGLNASEISFIENRKVPT